MRLYVSIHQNFKLWAVPFYNAPVELVTVLQLTTDPFPPEHDISELSAKAFSSDQTKGKEKEPRKVEKKKIKFSETEDKSTVLKGQSDDADSSKEAGSDGGEKDKYYIQSQNDLYQTSEFVKFVVPWGLGVFFVVIGQFWATIMCVLGTKIYDVLVWFPNKLMGSHFEAFRTTEDEATGLD